MLQPRLSALTPSAIHAARRDARRALLGLRILRPVLDRAVSARLRQALRTLLAITAESRDAYVQRALVLRLSPNLKVRARKGQAVVRELTSREAVAMAELAHRLRAPLKVQQWQRADLRYLRPAQFADALPPLGERRLQRTLQVLYRLLSKRIRAGRRVHRLRIRLRSAHDLAAIVPPSQVAAKRLFHKLDRMQEALGELHDCLLFKRWISTQHIRMPHALGGALQDQERRNLQESRRRRRPLRRAIRSYLKATAAP